ncbi:MAG: L-lactate permease [Armatimonadota bacterium]|jgi:lactate permease
MLTLLAILPIVVLIVDLVVFRRNILITAGIVAAVAIGIAVGVWRIAPLLVPASFVKGALVALDICLIILGALVFLNLLRSLGIIKAIEYHLGRVSTDSRVQLILLAWLFGSLIEGSAGFGTPAVIVVPLLVYIGYPAVFSVAAALVGNSVNAAFGAVGTPVRIGFQGLEVPGVVQASAGLGAIMCVFVPVILLGMMTARLREDRHFFFDALPFALFSGVAMGVPFYFASFIGIEFPSIVGALVAMGLVLVARRLGVLMPRQVHSIKERTLEAPERGVGSIVAPYALLLASLVVARYTLPSIEYPLFADLTHSVNFFNPGIVLLFVSALLTAWFRVSGTTVREVAGKSASALLRPALTIFFIVAVMQLMINSGQNARDLDSMLFYAFANIRNVALPAIAPLLGAFGSFVTGSVTVSNLTFGAAQASAAEAVGYPAMIILALQIIGATGGNTISIPNIMAAQAAGDMEGRENEILRATLPWVAVYLAVVIVLGLLMLQVVGG